MKCPICGHLVPPNTDRCPDCGYRCHNGHTQNVHTRERGYHRSPNKPSRPRGCCFCALVLLIPAMLLIAGIVFAVIENIEDTFLTPVPEPGIIEEAKPTESLPVEASDDCFSIQNGALTFLPERFEGERILRLPETVGGETVTALAPGCFRDCDMLTTIILPETLREIGREAFAGCTSLRGLALPKGSEKIAPRAFDGCVSMESVYLPGSLTQIAPDVFDDCASLLYLFYEGDFGALNELYGEYITPFTVAVCLDGSYYLGAGR